MSSRTTSPLPALLGSFSWQELRHHPWRNAAAVVAVMLGVALAFSVHLINASALDEFSSAVRSANAQPDAELRAVQGSFDEAVYARVAADPQVRWASPVLEVQTLARTSDGQRRPLRVLGVDALVVGALAPALMPAPAVGTPERPADRFSLFAPGQAFLNPAARASLGNGALQVQTGLVLRPVQVAGSVSAAGAPLAVMDIAAAQELFGRLGQLTRIDVQLRPGTDRAAWQRALALPPGIAVVEPGDAAARVSNLSRAYRVNLTVLALVALFTGAFLVYSVLSLGVAKRQQQFALLGVLGLSGRQRLRLVLAESLVLGVLGSAAGIALGTALAALALRVLGGDLGGGYFSGVAPSLQWSAAAAALYGALGVAAALAGGWWPARAMQALPPAQALKGLGLQLAGTRRRWAGPALMVVGALLGLAPPLFGIPVAAYVAVGVLLVGGIATLPWLIALLYDALAPRLGPRRLLALLAVERARRQRETAATAVSGVVASLSLAVALTVMVASFRESVTNWLDVVLPAELYLRTSNSSAANDTAYFDASLVQAIGQLEGVQRVAAVRTRALLLDAAQPSVLLIARPLDDPARTLPLVGSLAAVPPGQIGVYVSEAMVDLYGERPGPASARLSEAIRAAVPTGRAHDAPFFIAGVWRDYVRQFGAVAMERRDYERLSGDRRANEIALWLAAGADEQQVQTRIRALAAQQGSGAGPAAGDGSAADAIEFASAAQLRATSLRIFDRSFAVTYWLQAVAIGIGLFGIAASFSAQVLARRKEFGLLAHLGFTRRQVLALVAGEGAAWTAAGALAGLALGLAVSVVLVHVVNPQSFHWTMELLVPWLRLALLCFAVLAAGTLTAWLAGRAAASREAVLAVKEDW